MNDTTRLEFLTFTEIISDPYRILYLLGVLVIVVRLIILYIDLRNGRNEYKKYPLLNVLDDMSKNGVLAQHSAEDIDKSIIEAGIATHKNEDSTRVFKNTLKQEK